MARRGPVRVPDLEDDPRREHVDDTPTEVVLPPPPVIDAGVKKFYELANLHWPKKDQSISFDMRNQQMLRVVLGMVYTAMRARDSA